MVTRIDKKATGRLIQSLLRERGISARSAAKQLKISDQSVYKWGYGTRLPTAEHLVKLADLLNLPIEALLVVERR